jgi:hypothetical protein
MKIISLFLSVVVLASCASGKEKSYVGSTPAHPVIKSFLGIPLSDSIDFIKWKVVIRDDKYSLHCQFGIGKPNTDGFMNDGKTIELDGKLSKEKNYYFLQNGNRTLNLLALNGDLLHFLNNDNSLLVGNGGWSYTINAEKPLNTAQINILSTQSLLRDSVAFEGRTPCHNFAGVHPSTNCIKMKWLVILYANPKANEPTTYHLNGTYNRQGGKRGTWKTVTGKDGRVIYQLNVEEENESIHLLKLSEDILVFTDKEGKLLVGDKNFSYTLSRRW